MDKILLINMLFLLINTYKICVKFQWNKPDKYFQHFNELLRVNITHCGTY